MTNDELDALPGSMGGAMQNLRLLNMGFNMVRNVQALGTAESCPDVVSESGLSRTKPWSGAYPTPAELSDWYDTADAIITRVGRHPGIGLIDGKPKLEHLRLLWDALPIRIYAYATTPKEYIVKAAKIAQTAACLLHEAEFASRRAKKKSEGIDPGVPRPAEKDDSGWFEGLTDWFKLPKTGFTWPELPTTGDIIGWTMPPWWVLAGGAAILLFVVSRHPAVRQARKAIE